MSADIAILQRKRETLDDAAALQFSEKKWCWIPDKDNTFVAAYIVDEVKDQYKVRTADEKEVMVPMNQIEKMNPPKFEKVEDMVDLAYLNEPSVLHNLKQRYFSSLIYTYSGLFLVSVNPYQKLPIYTDAIVKGYKSKKRSEVPPHIFAIADQAYHAMLANRENQSILITGESGAGKTENTKKVIQYLGAIAGDSNNKQVGNLEVQLLQTNPILESFGNAQTVRNNNSSRFGKFIRIEFSNDGHISGGNVEWYLLEKSRVVYQTPNERNYHIFYQLLKGAPELTKKLLLLDGNVNNYQYTLKSNKVIDGVDDSVDFQSLMDALKVVGFSDDERFQLLRIVAAVLHLGNIKPTADREDYAQLPEPLHCEKTCHVLGINAKDFQQGLIKPKVKAGREVVVQAKTVEQVLFSIEALAKSLYERMFGALVDRLNVALDRPNARSTFIGVLDIAGFEIFETNSFEQLCINYTNEKLQQFFNHHMFVREQEEYQKEGLEWKYIDFGLDLQPTIDLIEKSNPIGVLSLLDEECVMPKATDKTFVEKLHGLWKGKNNKYDQPRFGEGFILNHYAAKVEYKTAGWLEKNKDPINDNITQLFSVSNEPFVADLFKDFNSVVDPKKASVTKKGVFRTVAQRHKEQLTSLMNQLATTQPHFVRCILPNEEKKPSKFLFHLVLHQLKCNGVLEGIRICRQGFPNRIQFADFKQRYEILAPTAVPKGFMDGKQASILILDAIKLDPQTFKIGHSKIFFKAGVLADLEEQRDLQLSHYMSTFQAMAKGYLQRRHNRRKLDQVSAIKTIQRNARIFIKLKEWSWYKLYSKVKPLLAGAMTEQVMRRQLEQLEQLQINMDNALQSKLLLEQQATLLANDQSKLQSELQSTRITNNEQSELLLNQRTRLDQLQIAHDALLKDNLEFNTLIKELLNAKSQLESQLKSTIDQLNDIQSQSQLLKSSNNATNTQFNVLKLEFTNITNHNAQLQSQLDKLNTDYTALSNDNNQLKSQFQSTTNQNTHSASQIQQLQSQLDQLQLKYDILLKSKTQVDAQLTQLQMNHDQLQIDHDQLQLNYNKLQVDHTQLQSQFTKEQAIRTQLDNDTRLLNTKCFQLQSELNTNTLAMTTLTNTKSKLTNELQELNNLLNSKNDQDTKQSTQLNRTQKQLTEVQSQLQIVQSELQSVQLKSQTQINELQQHSNQLQLELETLQSQKDTLIKSNNQQQQALEDLNNLKNKLDLQIRQITNDYNQCKLQFEEQQQQQHHEQQQTSQQQLLINQLQSQMSHLQLEKENLQQSVLKMTRLTEQLQQELQLENSNNQTLTTQKRQLQSELEQIEVQLQQGQLQLVELQRNNKLNVAQIGQLQQQLQMGQVQQTQLESELVTVTNELIANKDTQNQLQAQLQQVQASKSRLTIEIEDMHHELDTMASTLNKQNNKIKMLDATTLELTSQLETANTVTSTVQQALFKSNLQLESYKNELKEKQGQLSAMIKSKSDVETELQQLIDQIGLGDKNGHELDRKLKKTQLELNETQLELQMSMGDLTNTKTQLHAKSLELSDCRVHYEEELTLKDQMMDETRRLLLKEINDMGDQLDVLQQQNKQLVQQINGLKSELTGLEDTTRTKSDVEKKLKGLQQQQTQLQETNTQLLVKCQQFEDLSSRNERKVGLLQHDLDVHEEQFLESENKRKLVDSKYKDTQLHNEQLQQQLHTLESQLRQRTNDLNNANNEIEQLQTQITNTPVPTTNNTQLQMAHELQMEQQQQYTRALQIKYKLLEQEYLDKTSVVDALELKVSKLNGIQEQNQVEMDGARQRETQLMQINNKISKELQLLQSKLVIETEQQRGLNELININRAKLDSALNNNQLLEIELINKQNNVVQLNNKLKESISANEQLQIKQTQIESQLRSKMVELEHLKELQVELEELEIENQQNKQTVQGLQNKINLITNEQQMEMEELVKKQNGQRVVMQQEMNLLRQELEGLKGQLSTITIEKERQVQVVVQVKEELMQLQGQLQKSVMEQQRVQQQVKLDTQQIADLELQINAISKINRELRQKSDGDEMEMNRLQQLNKQLQGQLQNSSAGESKDNSALIKTITADRDELQILLQEEKMDHQVVKEKKRELEMRVQEGMNKLIKVGDELEHLNMKIGQLEVRNKELVGQLALQSEVPVVNNKYVQERLVELEGQLMVVQGEKEELQKQSRKTDRVVKEMQGQLVEMEKKKSDIGEELSVLQGKLKGIKGQLEEKEMQESLTALQTRKMQRDVDEYKEKSERMEKENERLKIRVERA